MLETTAQVTRKVLRPRETASYLGIALSTLWKWARNGKVPQPIRLSPKCTVWRVTDLDAFLEGQGL